jgi:hypothetical protein
MAFTIQNWGRSSVSANEPIVTLTSGVIVGSSRNYNYYSPIDVQATVAATGYFNTVIRDLAVGDSIRVYFAATLSTATFIVTSVTTNVALQVLGGNIATQTLTAANILAMNAAPVAITSAPAPGAGFGYVVDRFTLNKLVGTVAYANGGAISIEYGNTAAAGGRLATGTIAAGVLTGAAATTTFGMANGAANQDTSATIANLGLFISNDTAPFINGDSLVTVTVSYRLVPIT